MMGSYWYESPNVERKTISRSPVYQSFNSGLNQFVKMNGISNHLHRNELRKNWSHKTDADPMRDKFRQISCSEPTAERARIIAYTIKRHIIVTKEQVKRTPNFVKRTHAKMIYLHNYNCRVAQIISMYPFEDDLKKLLIKYIELEVNILRNPEHDTDLYRMMLERRLLKLLSVIYSKYSFYSVGKCNPYHAWKLILDLFEEVPYDIHTFFEDIRQKVKMKLDYFQDAGYQSCDPFLSCKSFNIHPASVETPRSVLECEELVISDGELIDTGQPNDDDIRIDRQNMFMPSLAERLKAVKSIVAGTVPKKSEIIDLCHDTQQRTSHTKTKFLPRSSMIDLVDSSDDEDSQKSCFAKSSPKCDKNLDSVVNLDDVSCKNENVISKTELDDEVIDISDGGRSDDICQSQDEVEILRKYREFKLLSGSAQVTFKTIDNKLVISPENNSDATDVYISKCRTDSSTDITVETQSSLEPVVVKSVNNDVVNSTVIDLCTESSSNIGKQFYVARNNLNMDEVNVADSSTRNSSHEATSLALQNESKCNQTVLIYKNSSESNLYWASSDSFQSANETESAYKSQNESSSGVEEDIFIKEKQDPQASEINELPEKLEDIQNKEIENSIQNKNLNPQSNLHLTKVIQNKETQIRTEQSDRVNELVPHIALPQTKETDNMVDMNAQKQNDHKKEKTTSSITDTRLDFSDEYENESRENFEVESEEQIDLKSSDPEIQISPECDYKQENTMNVGKSSQTYNLNITETELSTDVAEKTPKEQESQGRVVNELPEKTADIEDKDVENSIQNLKENKEDLNLQSLTTKNEESQAEYYSSEQIQTENEQIPDVALPDQLEEINNIEVRNAEQKDHSNEMFSITDTRLNLPDDHINIPLENCKNGDQDQIHSKSHNLDSQIERDCKPQQENRTIRIIEPSQEINRNITENQTYVLKDAFLEEQDSYATNELPENLEDTVNKKLEDLTESLDQGRKHQILVSNSTKTTHKEESQAEKSSNIRIEQIPDVVPSSAKETSCIVDINDIDDTVERSISEFVRRGDEVDHLTESQISLEGSSSRITENNADKSPENIHYNSDKHDREDLCVKEVEEREIVESLQEQTEEIVSQDAYSQIDHEKCSQGIMQEGSEEQKLKTIKSIEKSQSDVDETSQNSDCSNKEYLEEETFKQESSKPVKEYNGANDDTADLMLKHGREDDSTNHETQSENRADEVVSHDFESPSPEQQSKPRQEIKVVEKPCYTLDKNDKVSNVNIVNYKKLKYHPNIETNLCEAAEIPINGACLMHKTHCSNVEAIPSQKLNFDPSVIEIAPDDFVQNSFIDSDRNVIQEILEGILKALEKASSVSSEDVNENTMALPSKDDPDQKNKQSLQASAGAGEIYDSGSTAPQDVADERSMNAEKEPVEIVNNSGNLNKYVSEADEYTQEQFRIPNVKDTNPCENPLEFLSAVKNSTDSGEEDNIKLKSVQDIQGFELSSSFITKNKSEETVEAIISESFLHKNGTATLKGLNLTIKNDVGDSESPCDRKLETLHPDKTEIELQPSDVPASGSFTGCLPKTPKTVDKIEGSAPTEYNTADIHGVPQNLNDLSNNSSVSDSISINSENNTQIPSEDDVILNKDKTVPIWKPDSYEKDEDSDLDENILLEDDEEHFSHIDEESLLGEDSDVSLTPHPKNDCLHESSRDKHLDNFENQPQIDDQNQIQTGSGDFDPQIDSNRDVQQENELLIDAAEDVLRKQEIQGNATNASSEKMEDIEDKMSEDSSENTEENREDRSFQSNSLLTKTLQKDESLTRNIQYSSSPQTEETRPTVDIKDYQQKSLIADISSPADKRIDYQNDHEKKEDKAEVNLSGMQNCEQFSYVIEGENCASVYLDEYLVENTVEISTSEFVVCGDEIDHLSEIEISSEESKAGSREIIDGTALKNLGHNLDIHNREDLCVKELEEQIVLESLQDQTEKIDRRVPTSHDVDSKISDQKSDLMKTTKSIQTAQDQIDETSQEPECWNTESLGREETVRLESSEPEEPGYCNTECLGKEETVRLESSEPESNSVVNDDEKGFILKHREDDYSGHIEILSENRFDEVVSYDSASPSSVDQLNISQKSCEEIKVVEENSTFDENNESSDNVVYEKLNTERSLCKSEEMPPRDACLLMKTDYANVDIKSSQNLNLDCENTQIRPENVTLLSGDVVQNSKDTDKNVIQEILESILKALEEASSVSSEEVNENTMALPSKDDPDQKTKQSLHCSAGSDVSHLYDSGLTTLQHITDELSTNAQPDPVEVLNKFRNLKKDQVLQYTPEPEKYTQEQLRILNDEETKARENPLEYLRAVKNSTDSGEDEVLNLTSSKKFGERDNIKSQTGVHDIEAVELLKSFITKVNDEKTVNASVSTSLLYKNGTTSLKGLNLTTNNNVCDRKSPDVQKLNTLQHYQVRPNIELKPSDIPTAEKFAAYLPKTVDKMESSVSIGYNTSDDTVNDLRESLSKFGTEITSKLTESEGSHFSDPASESEELLIDEDSCVRQEYLDVQSEVILGPHENHVNSNDLILPVSDNFQPLLGKGANKNRKAEKSMKNTITLYKAEDDDSNSIVYSNPSDNTLSDVILIRERFDDGIDLKASRRKPNILKRRGKSKSPSTEKKKYLQPKLSVLSNEPSLSRPKTKAEIKQMPLYDSFQNTSNFSDDDIPLAERVRPRPPSPKKMKSRYGTTDIVLVKQSKNESEKGMLKKSRGKSDDRTRAALEPFLYPEVSLTEEVVVKQAKSKKSNREKKSLAKERQGKRNCRKSGEIRRDLDKSAKTSRSGRKSGEYVNDNSNLKVDDKEVRTYRSKLRPRTSSGSEFTSENATVMKDIPLGIENKKIIMDTKNIDLTPLEIDTEIHPKNVKKLRFGSPRSKDSAKLSNDTTEKPLTGRGRSRKSKKTASNQNIKSSSREKKSKNSKTDDQPAVGDILISPQSKRTFEKVIEVNLPPFKPTKKHNLKLDINQTVNDSTSPSRFRVVTPPEIREYVPTTPLTSPVTSATAPKKRYIREFEAQIEIAKNLAIPKNNETQPHGGQNSLSDLCNDPSDIKKVVHPKLRRKSLSLFTQRKNPVIPVIDKLKNRLQKDLTHLVDENCKDRSSDTSTSTEHVYMSPFGVGELLSNSGQVETVAGQEGDELAPEKTLESRFMVEPAMPINLTLKSSSYDSGFQDTHSFDSVEDAKVERSPHCVSDSMHAQYKETSPVTLNQGEDAPNPESSVDISAEYSTKVDIVGEDDVPDFDQNKKTSSDDLLVQNAVSLSNTEDTVEVGKLATADDEKKIAINAETKEKILNENILLINNSDTYMKLNVENLGKNNEEVVESNDPTSPVVPVSQCDIITEGNAQLPPASSEKYNHGGDENAVIKEIQQMSKQEGNLINKSEYQQHPTESSENIGGGEEIYEVAKKEDLCNKIIENGDQFPADSLEVHFEDAEKATTNKTVQEISEQERQCSKNENIDHLRADSSEQDIYAEEKIGAIDPIQEMSKQEEQCSKYDDSNHLPEDPSEQDEHDEEDPIKEMSEQAKQNNKYEDFDQLPAESSVQDGVVEITTNSEIQEMSKSEELCDKIIENCEQFPANSPEVLIEDEGQTITKDPIQEKSKLEGQYKKYEDADQLPADPPEQDIYGVVEIATKSEIQEKANREDLCNIVHINDDKLTAESLEQLINRGEKIPPEYKIQEIPKREDVCNKIIKNVDQLPEDSQKKHIEVEDVTVTEDPIQERQCDQNEDADKLRAESSKQDICGEVEITKKPEIQEMTKQNVIEYTDLSSIVSSESYIDGKRGVSTKKQNQGLASFQNESKGQEIVSVDSSRNTEFTDDSISANMLEIVPPQNGHSSEKVIKNKDLISSPSEEIVSADNVFESENVDHRHIATSVELDSTDYQCGDQIPKSTDQMASQMTNNQTEVNDVYDISPVEDCQSDWFIEEQVVETTIAIESSEHQEDGNEIGETEIINDFKEDVSVDIVNDSKTDENTSNKTIDSNDFDLVCIAQKAAEQACQNFEEQGSFFDDAKLKQEIVDEGKEKLEVMVGKTENDTYVEHKDRCEVTRGKIGDNLRSYSRDHKRRSKELNQNDNLESGKASFSRQSRNSSTLGDSDSEIEIKRKYSERSKLRKRGSDKTHKGSENESDRKYNEPHHKRDEKYRLEKYSTSSSRKEKSVGFSKNRSGSSIEGKEVAVKDQNKEVRDKYRSRYSHKNSSRSSDREYKNHDRYKSEYEKEKRRSKRYRDRSKEKYRSNTKDKSVRHNDQTRRESDKTYSDMKTRPGNESVGKTSKSRDKSLKHRKDISFERLFVKLDRESINKYHKLVVSKDYLTVIPSKIKENLDVEQNKKYFDRSVQEVGELTDASNLRKYNHKRKSYDENDIIETTPEKPKKKKLLHYSDSYDSLKHELSKSHHDFKRVSKEQNESSEPEVINKIPGSVSEDLDGGKIVESLDTSDKEMKSVNVSKNKDFFSIENVSSDSQSSENVEKKELKTTEHPKDDIIGSNSKVPDQVQEPNEYVETDTTIKNHENLCEDTSKELPTEVQENVSLIIECENRTHHKIVEHNESKVLTQEGEHRPIQISDQVEEFEPTADNLAQSCESDGLDLNTASTELRDTHSLSLLSIETHSSSTEQKVSTDVLAHCSIDSTRVTEKESNSEESTSRVHSDQEDVSKISEGVQELVPIPQIPLESSTDQQAIDFTSAVTTKASVILESEGVNVLDPHTKSSDEPTVPRVLPDELESGSTEKKDSGFPETSDDLEETNSVVRDPKKSSEETYKLESSDDHKVDYTVTSSKLRELEANHISPTEGELKELDESKKLSYMVIDFPENPSTDGVKIESTSCKPLNSVPAELFEKQLVLANLEQSDHGSQNLEKRFCKQDVISKTNEEVLQSIKSKNKRKNCNRDEWPSQDLIEDSDRIGLDLQPLPQKLRKIDKHKTPKQNLSAVKFANIQGRYQQNDPKYKRISHSKPEKLRAKCDDSTNIPSIDITTEETTEQIPIDLPTLEPASLIESQVKKKTSESNRKVDVAYFELSLVTEVTESSDNLFTYTTAGSRNNCIAEDAIHSVPLRVVDGEVENCHLLHGVNLSLDRKSKQDIKLSNQSEVSSHNFANPEAVSNVNRSDTENSFVNNIFPEQKVSDTKCLQVNKSSNGNIDECNKIPGRFDTTAELNIINNSSSVSSTVDVPSELNTYNVATTTLPFTPTISALPTTMVDFHVLGNEIQDNLASNIEILFDSSKHAVSSSEDFYSQPIMNVSNKHNLPTNHVQTLPDYIQELKQIVFCENETELSHSDKHPTAVLPGDVEFLEEYTCTSPENVLPNYKNDTFKSSPSASSVSQHSENNKDNGVTNKVESSFQNGDHTYTMDVLINGQTENKKESHEYSNEYGKPITEFALDEIQFDLSLIDESNTSTSVMFCSATSMPTDVGWPFGEESAANPNEIITSWNENSKVIVEPQPQPDSIYYPDFSCLTMSCDDISEQSQGSDSSLNDWFSSPKNADLSVKKIKLNEMDSGDQDAEEKIRGDSKDVSYKEETVGMEEKKVIKAGKKKIIDKPANRKSLKNKEEKQFELPLIPIRNHGRTKVSASRKSSVTHKNDQQNPPDVPSISHPKLDESSKGEHDQLPLPLSRVTRSAVRKDIRENYVTPQSQSLYNSKHKSLTDLENGVSKGTETRIASTTKQLGSRTSKPSGSDFTVESLLMKVVSDPITRPVQLQNSNTLAVSHQNARTTLSPVEKSKSPGTSERTSSTGILKVDDSTRKPHFNGKSVRFQVVNPAILKNFNVKKSPAQGTSAPPLVALHPDNQTKLVQTSNKPQEPIKNVLNTDAKNALVAENKGKLPHLKNTEMMRATNQKKQTTGSLPGDSLVFETRRRTKIINEFINQSSKRPNAEERGNESKKPCNSPTTTDPFDRLMQSPVSHIFKHKEMKMKDQKGCNRTQIRKDNTHHFNTHNSVREQGSNSGKYADKHPPLDVERPKNDSNIRSYSPTAQRLDKDKKSSSPPNPTVPNLMSISDSSKSVKEMKSHSVKEAKPPSSANTPFDGVMNPPDWVKAMSVKVDPESWLLPSQRRYPSGSGSSK